MGDSGIPDVTSAVRGRLLPALGRAVPALERILPAAGRMLPGLAALRRALPDVNVVRMVSTADQAVNSGLIAVKRRRRLLRPIVVLPYLGWYADGVAHMTARAVERPLFAPSVDTRVGIGRAFAANLRRFTVLTMSGVRVRASMGATSAEFVSDSGGYLAIELPVGPLIPGWHVLDLHPVEAGTLEHTTGRVLVPDPRGGLAVISDIDDTILRTGLTERFAAAGNTFLRDVLDRSPVPGMATFYAGLARGVGEQLVQVPFYYVSTGSWNYYDYLVAFMGLHHFPRGPLFLTDWGPTADRLMRDGREHKRRAIRRLIEGHPAHSFVLVGDVGQGDPETYELIAREFPGRIRAIFVVHVGAHLSARSSAVAARAARLREEEAIPMHCVANAAEAVTVAWQLGLVDQETTAAIARTMGVR